MNNHNYFDTTDVPKASWIGVRHIYKKLSDEFNVLTDAFDISVDSKTKRYLNHLIVAIDEIDTCVDDIASKKERDSITKSLINYLGDNSLNWKHNKATPSLAKKIKNLKKIVVLENIDIQFIEAAQTIFDLTERKRHTKDYKLLIDFVVDEGKATARLPLSILKIEAHTPFGKFFTDLCKLMGVADLIIDAMADYRANQIALKPSISLYLKLIKMAVLGGIRLIWGIPHKFRFLLYCFRFGIALLRS